MVGYPDQNKLRLLSKTPSYPNNFPIPSMPKKNEDLRGPELIHNKLIHKQYGIVALSGGNLLQGHLEMMRNTINKKLDFSRSFAIWRVDPPWKPITRHGQGKKLGGGKGGISHYVTPVKRGRIIIEVGGTLPYESLYRTMVDVAQKLPFPAKFVSQQELENWEKEEEYVRVNNLNKLRYEWCIKNNILNVLNYVGKYDIEYAHYGPDLR